MAAQPHTPNEMQHIFTLGSALYRMLKEGESIQLMFPTSDIMNADGEQPMGYIIISKPGLLSFLNTRIVPPTVSGLPIKGNETKPENPTNAETFAPEGGADARP